MSKDASEIASDITVAWVSSTASTVDARVTGEVVAEFYKTVYEVVNACVHPQREAKGFPQKPPGW